MIINILMTISDQLLYIITVYYIVESIVKRVDVSLSVPFVTIQVQVRVSPSQKSKSRVQV